jgi:hypothetical protein
MNSDIKVISDCTIAGQSVAKGGKVPDGATLGELRQLAAIGKLVLGEDNSPATPATPAAKQAKA